MHLDFLKYAIRSMRHRQLRAWLTILGIVIGIAAIVALISAAQGLDAEIKRQLEFFAGDIIVVMPGSMEAMVAGGGALLGPQTGVITEGDEEALRKLGGILFVGSSVEDRIKIQFKDEYLDLFAAGIEPIEAFFEAFDFYELESGRYLKENDRQAVMFGYNVAHELFEDEVRVNQRVKIGGKSYRVVGILKKSGGEVMAIMDSSIIMKRDEARENMARYEDDDHLTEIYVQARPGADLKVLEEAMNRELMRRHHILREEDKDFTVVSPEFISERIGTITGLLTLFLGGIASIALLVGGIGIANTMYMSVLERTREIGTLKAIGASSSAILEIFLIESGLMGLVGGVLGVAAGSILAFIASMWGVPFLISAELVGFALFFSVGVGVLSGIAPARSAAALAPVDALRHE